MLQKPSPKYDADADESIVVTVTELPPRISLEPGEERACTTRIDLDHLNLELPDVFALALTIVGSYLAEERSTRLSEVLSSSRFVAVLVDAFLAPLWKNLTDEQFAAPFEAFFLQHCEEALAQRLRRLGCVADEVCHVL
jgi:hypothetical protein